MTAEPIASIRACVFDAYGHLFDFAAAVARCDDSLGSEADRLTALWRNKQLRYT
jgi:2-haloacid dehalogenase